MSARLGIPLEVVAAITDTCWVTITEQLAAGEKVTMHGMISTGFYP